MDLDAIISDTENRQVEFKESENPAMYKTLSAFSNTNGGVLLVGVADDKTIIGFNCSNNKIKQITDTIANKLLIHPVITSHAIDGKKILKIEVSKSPNPVSYDGKYYSRVGNTTREMQAEELRTYFLRTTLWDNIPGDFNPDEIDEQTVKYFVKLGLDSGRMPISAASERKADKWCNYSVRQKSPEIFHKCSCPNWAFQRRRYYYRGQNSRWESVPSVRGSRGSDKRIHQRQIRDLRRLLQEKRDLGLPS